MMTKLTSTVHSTHFYDQLHNLDPALFALRFCRLCRNVTGRELWDLKRNVHKHFIFLNPVFCSLSPNANRPYYSQILSFTCSLLMSVSESNFSKVVTMSGRRMKVSKCPSDSLTMTNRAIVNGQEFDTKSCPHIDVRTGPGQHFVFTVEPDSKVR